MGFSGIQSLMDNDPIGSLSSSMDVLTINLNPVVELSDEQFYQLCQINRDLKFERTAKGELIIMPPTGGETGNRNAEIAADLVIWNRQTKLGVVFDSSSCFKLPRGGERSPDAAWIQQERWDTLTPEQKEKFPPICPDFVIELMSPSDSLEVTQQKMQGYQENGVHLGWLLNRKTQQVEIYRLGQATEVLQSPATLSGEDVLPGFILNLQSVW